MQNTLTWLLLCITVLFIAGCRSKHEANKPSVVFTHVPPVGRGPESLEHVSGRVENAPPGTRIVLYALTRSTWWVQPFRSHPITDLAKDGSWDNVTHLGTDYAALLVAPGYQPTQKLTSLPALGGGVLAMVKKKASTEQLAEPKTIHFSGYDWMVRSSLSDRAGSLCDYEPSNAWVDERGFLHLLMNPGQNHWNCAGISLTRSLGYGTYRFVVPDSASLPPSAVLSLFTQDVDSSEMAVELSRWGKSSNRNADYVIQPWYIPENTIHFEVPNGPVTHMMRWEPGRVNFKSFAGTSDNPRAVVMEHVFKSGVPVPARETVHIVFYDFHHSQGGLQHPVEVVVQKFEYLP